MIGAATEGFEGELESGGSDEGGSAVVKLVRVAAIAEKLLMCRR